MKIHLIVNENARAGRKQSICELAETVMREAGAEYELHVTRRPGDAKTIARELSLPQEEKTVWVIGGDGTLNEAVNGLVINDSLRFALVPAGSGNDFARGMGLPQRTGDALRLLLKTEQIRAFDVGRVELLDCLPAEESAEEPVRQEDCRTGLTFAGSCGCGYDAEVCFEVNRAPLKKWLNRLHAGKLSYFVTAVKQVFQNPRFRMTLISNGISRSFTDVIFACFMIHPYEGGGLRMAPAANPTDGKLSLVVAHGISRFRVLTLLPTLLRGTHVKHPEILTFDCGEAEIIADRALHLHTDGEVVYRSRHFRVSCVPEHLRMPDTTRIPKASAEASPK